MQRSSRIRQDPHSHNSAQPSDPGVAIICAVVAGIPRSCSHFEKSTDCLAWTTERDVSISATKRRRWRSSPLIPLISPRTQQDQTRAGFLLDVHAHAVRCFCRSCSQQWRHVACGRSPYQERRRCLGGGERVEAGCLCWCHMKRALRANRTNSACSCLAIVSIRYPHTAQQGTGLHVHVHVSPL